MHRRLPWTGLAAAAALAAACSTSTGEVASGRNLDAAASGGSAGMADAGNTTDAGGGSVGSGGSAGAPACDSRFSISPDPPGSGTLTSVGFTDTSPLTYIKLDATGPGTATLVTQGITTSNPWTWTWSVTDLAPGVWTFTFSAGSPQKPVATCQKNVLDTGTPPPPPPPPKGSCDGKVCGDDDGNGGKCTTCPMVGSCLSPPSPYGPGGKGSWSCLDTAGCLEGSGLCKIWCPFEPCDTQKHPNGCPNNTEACYVPAGTTSYEDACKSCCESAPRNSCWDSAYSLCRYPGECGTPLP
jgi:hypothetical protein